jgi:hypothetical protein
MASQGWGTSPRYSRTHLIAGAPPIWFAGGIIVPGERNKWCAGNKMVRLYLGLNRHATLLSPSSPFPNQP